MTGTIRHKLSVDDGALGVHFKLSGTSNLGESNFIRDIYANNRDGKSNQYKQDKAVPAVDFEIEASFGDHHTFIADYMSALSEFSDVDTFDNDKYGTIGAAQTKIFPNSPKPKAYYLEYNYKGIMPEVGAPFWPCCILFRYKGCI